MVEYSKVNVKLSETQLKKPKNSVKNKTATTLTTSLKMFNGKDLPHELLNFQEIIQLKDGDGAYVINFDEYADVGTHWIVLFCNRNEIVYFDSLGVEHVPEEIKEFVGNKNIKANIFRVQANDSVMCGYFCIGFIDFMLAGKKLTDYTSLFSPHDFKKNDNINLSFFNHE